MAEIRRYSPVVWREIYAIPTFGGAVWRKNAAGNRKVTSNVRTGHTSKWPGSCFQSPDQWPQDTSTCNVAFEASDHAFPPPRSTVQQEGFKCCRLFACHRHCAQHRVRSDVFRLFLRRPLQFVSAARGSRGRVALNALILPGGRDGQGPRNDLQLLWGGSRAGNAWDWFAAGMVQAGLLIQVLARSREIRVFRYTLAREPLEHTDRRPLHKLEGPLTRRHESSRKRYTMALAGTAGLALTPSKRPRFGP